MSFKSIAEIYLIAGLNPLPLRENKAPNLPKGHKFLYDENTELFNFESKETKKIGIACGRVSENLLCIDFDKHQGQDIYTVFKAYLNCPIIKLLIKFSKVSIYETPSKGYHLIFRSERPIKGTTLARFEDGNIMIETRGDGQYIACFPSEGYKFLYGCDITNLKKLDEDETDFLLDRCIIFNKDISKVVKKTGSLLTDEQKKWPEKWSDETPDGIFNNTGAEHVKNLLIDRGWSLSKDTKEKDEIEYWIRPGKLEEDGISATFGFKFNMFYVFTDSPDILPLKKDTAYSPFSLLTELEYNGDWKQAKDDLRDNYGLKPIMTLPNNNVENLSEINEINFPIEVFPNDYINYINATSSALSYSPDYTSCGMLMAVATAIGNKIKVRVKNGYIDSPIFWMGIVGSRGASKTHPLTMSLSPFKRIEDLNFEKYLKQMEVFNSLKDEEKNKTKKPLFKQMLLADYTIESLQQALYYNKKGLLIYKDELKGWFKDMNKYKQAGSDEEFFLESFNNGSVTINRKTQDTVRLNKIFINVIGTIQDEILTELASSHTDNGLMDRFLFTRSEKLAKTLTKESLNEDYIEWWFEKIKTIVNEFKYIDHEDIVICDFTENAFNYLLEVENIYTVIQNDETTLPALQNYYAKLKTYLKRFSLLIMIIEYIEDGTELLIEIDHVKKAELIITYFSKSAENIFNGNRTYKETTEIFNTLKGNTNIDKIIALHKKGLNNSQIAKMIGVSRQTVIRTLKK